MEIRQRISLGTLFISLTLDNPAYIPNPLTVIKEMQGVRDLIPIFSDTSYGLRYLKGIFPYPKKGFSPQFTSLGIYYFDTTLVNCERDSPEYVMFFCGSETICSPSLITSARSQVNFLCFVIGILLIPVGICAYAYFYSMDFHGWIFRLLEEKNRLWKWAFHVLTPIFR